MYFCFFPGALLQLITKQRQLFFLPGSWSDGEVRLRVVEFVRTDDSVPLYPLVDLGILAVGGWNLLSMNPGSTQMCHYCLPVLSRSV